MYSEKSTIEKSVSQAEVVSQVDSPYDKEPSASKWQDFKDSFKESHDNHLVQGISKRHLRMMAISTGTGTGLMVAASAKLSSAGPAGLLIAYAILGYLMLIPMVYCVSEISIAYPGLPGGFASYFNKFIDSSLGAALGWNYYFNWLVVIPLEIVTATMTIKFWTTSINPDAWVPIFIVVVLVLNISSRVYGEAEFFFNMCKLLMLSGFIIFGLCVTLGASKSGFIGGRYYHDPGAFTPSPFKGLVTVFVSGAFSLGGSEFISLSAAEVQNPTAAIRSASKFAWIKITILFMGALCFVGLLVPYNEPRLMGSGAAATSASPFVLAGVIHSVAVLPHIINVVILLSVTSVATAAFYCTTRMLQALAEQGLAPKIFKVVDRAGRPRWASFVSLLAMFFAFIACFKYETDVFNWMLSISAMSFVLLWLFIGVAFIRWRQALKFNNIPLSSLAYVSPTGITGAWLCIVINFLILVAQFWVGLWPYNGDGPDKVNITAFFQAYLGVIFFLVSYIAHKLYARYYTKERKLTQVYLKLDEIDIDGGRHIYDPEMLEMQRFEEREAYKKAPIWKKLYIICFD
ncbi:general amino acid permease Agp1p [Diutina catenulata]